MSFVSFCRSAEASLPCVMWRPYIRELGYQVGVRPHVVPRHLPICEDAHEHIERVVGECPAVIGKRRRARWVVKQDIWEQCPRYPPRLSRRISTHVLQSVCESSKETPILSRFTREVGIPLFGKQDRLRRTCSALRLDETAAIACRERARPQCGGGSPFVPRRRRARSAPGKRCRQPNRHRCQS